MRQLRARAAFTKGPTSALVTGAVHLRAAAMREATRITERNEPGDNAFCWLLCPLVDPFDAILRDALIGFLNSEKFEFGLDKTAVGS